MEKFEKYLLNKRQHLTDMLKIVHNEQTKLYIQLELSTVEDIIHHFNVFVKGEMSSGLGDGDEE
jgi:CTP-dependent riboflavin kinase